MDDYKNFTLLETALLSLLKKRSQELKDIKEAIPHFENSTTIEAYGIAIKCLELMDKKNTDYGDSWKLMTLAGIIDQLVVKSHRLQRINHRGHSEISEGVESELMDILNYSLLAMLKLTLESR